MKMACNWIQRSLVVVMIIATVTRAAQGSCPVGCNCHVDQSYMICRDVKQLPDAVPPGIKDLIFEDCIIGTELKRLPDNYSETQVLTIRNSALQTIEIKAFERLTNLHTLNLQGNSLTNVNADVLFGLESLRELNLQANKLEKFEEDTLQHNSKMEILILNNNPGIQLARRSFAQPEGTDNLINRIELRDCGLSDVPTAAVCPSKVPKLSTLDLSKNNFENLGEFNFKHAPGLVFLNLDSCKIQKIERETLGALTRLETLFLSNNDISTIDEQAFDDFYSTAKYIYLERNKLTKVHGTIFNFEILQVLNVSYNPWDCSCDNGWLQEFPAKPNNTNHNITCASPEAFKDQNALTVMTTEFGDCHPSGPNPMVAVYVAIPILIILTVLTIIIIVKLCKQKSQKRSNSAQYSLVYKPTTEKA